MFRGTVVEVFRPQERPPIVVVRPETGTLEMGERVWLLLEPPVAATVKSFDMPRRMSPLPEGEVPDLCLVLDCAADLYDVAKPGTQVASSENEPAGPAPYPG